MSIDVIVPYGGDCRYRARAWQWVQGQYEDNYPAWHVIVGSHEGAWNKPLAVADALERSDADLVVIADADVWTDDLAPAVRAVREGAPWAVPHHHVWRLSQHSTTAFIAGSRDRLTMEQMHAPVLGGGIVVLPRDTYEDCPLDPRFVGWGGEDIAWGTALTTLHGPPTKLTGRLWHLWHPPQARRSRVRGSLENTLRAGRYTEHRRDPEAMRALVDEGRAWASNASSSLPSLS